LSLAEFLSRRRELDELLSECVTRAAALVGSPRASIQVLDHTRAQLIARCRAGEPVHGEPAPFALGEGLAGWIALHARAICSGDAERDERFVARATRSIPLALYLGVPLVAGGECLGVLSFTHVKRDAFDARHEAIASLVASLVAPHVELARLARLTRIDPLTGVLNRRGLAAVERAEEAQETLGSVICADLDHFKDVNDRHGHAVGDRVLVMVADALASSVRRGDSVARTGGEEFVVVLPGAPLAAALRIAESARATIAATVIDGPGGPVRITSSFGVAEQRAGESHEAAVGRADAALYAAKRAGRNRVKAG
jgi:diguanylate cyclase (GGDEF)-like protein